jgi:hypothetical protein
LRLKSLLPAALLPFCAGVPAIGVGQALTSVTSECLPAGSLYSELLPRWDFVPLIASPACGVRHSLVAAVRVSATPRLTRRPADSESSARAVGHDEQSLTAVAGAGFGRSEDSSRNAATQSLQCRDDGCKLSVRVPRDVFAEETISPAFVEHPDDLIDEEPVIICSKAAPGHAIGLARVSRSDEIHDSAPWPAVEGSKVRPDSRRSQLSRFHARNQCCGCIGFPLHVSDATHSGLGNVDAKLKPADSGADGDAVDGMNSHVTVSASET